MSNPNTISLAEARIRIKKLLKLASTMPTFEKNADLVPRAMFIPIKDIIEIISKYDTQGPDSNLSGIRMYFGVKEILVDPINSVHELCGMIVPVLKNGTKAGTDHLEIYNNDINSTQTNIYDFTSPCPKNCDKSSALYINSTSLI